MAEMKKPLDAADIEKLLKGAEPARKNPAKELKDSQYFNPWNMGKKRSPAPSWSTATPCPISCLKCNKMSLNH